MKEHQTWQFASYSITQNNTARCLGSICKVDNNVDNIFDQLLFVLLVGFPVFVFLLCALQVVETPRSSQTPSFKRQDATCRCRGLKQWKRRRCFSRYVTLLYPGIFCIPFNENPKLISQSRVWSQACLKKTCWLNSPQKNSLRPARLKHLGKIQKIQCKPA